MTGLYNGVAGLSGWSGLWGSVAGLWSGATGLQNGGGGYSPEAEAYFAAMVVQPDATRKTLLNNLIVALVSGGVWAKLDWLTIHAAHDEQAARVNAITPAQVATAVNSPTFTTDRGFTGDGSTSYLKSNTAPTLFVRDSAHLGVWVGTNVLSTGVDAGHASRSVIISRNTSTAMRAIPNSFSAADFTISATSIGHSAWSRGDASNVSGYRDGASLGSVANSSTVVTPPAFYICAARALSSDTPTLYSTRRIQAAHWGSHLTSGEVTSLYNALSTYMTAVGA